MSQPPPSTDSLPKQFVLAMRTLFDIMDDRRTGFVKLTDIENRWRDDRTRGLPRGVIDNLQKVALPDGLLTFDRFCAGLKICLLRNQPVQTKLDNDHVVRGQLKVQVHRPPSAPLLDVDDTAPNSNWAVNGPICDKSSQQRTISMPQLVPRHELENGPTYNFESEKTKSHLYGPPKPPRVERNDKESIKFRYKPEEPVSNNDLESRESLKVAFGVEIPGTRSRGPGDGKAAELAPHHRPGRRREPRRHTLQNGIDYNLIKRMKQFEQEKDILVQGLGAVENAREWYLKQLAEVQEKVRFAGRMGAHVEQWTEAQQERLELQRARVLELNRQLASLAECWHRGGLSLHMNLALSPHHRSEPPRRPAAPTTDALKRQNHLLTEEVSKKSERISVLEREKSALIRELLVITNRNKAIENVF